MRRSTALMVWIAAALALPGLTLARVIHGPAGSGQSATVDIQFKTKNRHPTIITRFEFNNIPANCVGSFPTAVSDTFAHHISVSPAGNFHASEKTNSGRATYTVSGHFSSQSKAIGSLRIKGTVPGCLSADTGAVHWSAKH